MTTTFEREPGYAPGPNTLSSAERSDGRELVADALDDIDATRAQIGSELDLPRDSAEVTAATDEALVYVAERTLQSSESSLADRQGAVDDVAIETALEMDGGADASTTPVAEFEFKGYGDSIDDVVRRLHESHATLPNGHEAAPLVMMAVDKLVGHSDGLTAPEKPGATIEYVDTSVERSANYDGNWTERQTDRMSSNDFKDRFARFIQHGADGLTDARPTDMFAKPGVPRSEYLERVDGFEDLVDATTSRIEYGPAGNYGRQPSVLGTVTEHEGEKKVILFSDAQKDGESLTDRQKDIIAAHEMYHRVVAPDGLNVEQVRSGFSMDAFYELKGTDGYVDGPSTKYMSSPHELTARMAQIKNYFGMAGGERFTQAHLDYARDHYVADTGLDNSMSEFLAMAKNADFVDLMNTIPV